MKRNNEARNWGVSILLVLGALVLICAFVFGASKIFGTSNSKEQQELTPQELYWNGFLTGENLGEFRQLISIAILENRITDAKAEELLNLYERLSEDILNKEEVTEKVSKEFNEAVKKVYKDSRVNASQEKLLLTSTKIDIIGFMDGFTWVLYDEIIVYEYILEHITEAEFEEYLQKDEEYWAKFIENPSHEKAEEFFDYVGKMFENLILTDEPNKPQFPSTIEGTHLGAFTLSKEFLE